MLMGAVRRGPAHGYGIIAELREGSGGEFDLAEGAIYPALHRIEPAGLIESTVESAQGRRRRTYALTEQGRKEFTSQRPIAVRMTPALTSGVAMLAMAGGPPR